MAVVATTAHVVASLAVVAAVVVLVVVAGLQAMTVAMTVAMIGLRPPMTGVETTALPAAPTIASVETASVARIMLHVHLQVLMPANLPGRVHPVQAQEVVRAPQAL